MDKRLTNKHRTIYVLLVILTLIFLSACAQPPPNQVQFQNEMMTDFASGCSSSVDYVTDNERTFITLDIDNPRQQNLAIWISQSYITPNAQTIRKRRLSNTNQAMISHTVKAARLEEGVKEVIIFEIYDTNGTALFSTKPIESKGNWDQKKIASSPRIKTNDLEIR